MTKIRRIKEQTYKQLEDVLGDMYDVLTPNQYKRFCNNIIGTVEVYRDIVPSLEVIVVSKEDREKIEKDFNARYKRL